MSIQDLEYYVFRMTYQFVCFLSSNTWRSHTFWQRCEKQINFQLRSSFVGISLWPAQGIVQNRLQDLIYLSWIEVWCLEGFSKKCRHRWWIWCIVRDPKPPAMHTFYQHLSSKPPTCRWIWHIWMILGLGLDTIFMQYLTCKTHSIWHKHNYGSL